MRFDILPNTPSSTKEFKHWFRTFEYYLEVLPNKGLDNTIDNNTIFAGHLLATHWQQHGETFDEYIQALKILANNCNFQAASVIQYQHEAIRDAFINGINLNDIRQCLLENSDMTLDSMICKACANESAQKHSENYFSSQYQSHHSASTSPPNSNNKSLPLYAAQKPNNRIYFCGNNRHPRPKCPVHEVDLIW